VIRICQLIFWGFQPEPQQPEPQQHAEDRGDIQSTQKPVDQCYFTSYQNTHDKHFSQEVVFGEEDFKFFDINMMAENMGPSENMVRASRFVHNC
jgi:hypothetical protein